MPIAMIDRTGPKTPKIFNREDTNGNSIKPPENRTPVCMNGWYGFDDTPNDIEKNQRE
jgi:hypothetical protein